MRIARTTIVVVSLMVIGTLFIGCTDNKTKLQQFSTNDNLDVVVEYVDQGAHGSYVEITIIKEDSFTENFYVRSEDAIPSVDSIYNDTIYMHYENFPSRDSILDPRRVLLGESLLKSNSRFTLNIKNKR